MSPIVLIAPVQVAQQAQLVSGTSYAIDIENKGLFVDYNAIYDLTVSQDFIPRSGDGEVDTFKLVPVQELHQYLSGATKFYPAAALVVIDCLLRHGHVDLAQDCKISEFGHSLHRHAELMNLLRIGDSLPPWELCPLR